MSEGEDILIRVLNVVRKLSMKMTYQRYDLLNIPDSIDDDDIVKYYFRSGNAVKA